MDYIARLPSLVRYALAAGAALLFAFKDRLPNGWQDVALVVSVLMLAFFVVGALVHFLRERRGGKKVSPTDLMVLGLVGLVIFGLIALSGLLWQHYGPPPVPPAAAAAVETKELKPQKLKTRLRLQFFGDDRVPTEVGSDNIESWYTLWTPSVRGKFLDKHGKEFPGGFGIPKTWSIFVLFKKPITYRELVVTFSGAPIPPYEVKASNVRYAIVFVAAEVPAGDLEIGAKLE